MFDNFTIFENGQVINITDNGNGYNVVAVSQKSFTDMSIKQSDLNATINRLLDSLEIIGKFIKSQGGKKNELDYKNE